MVEFGIEFVPRDLYWKTTFYAIQAEKIGFDYLWITDHFNNRNVYVSLAIASAYTERIKFGPGVTNPYLVHPVVTAQAVATLDEIAPGRVVCGLGAGDKTTLQMVNLEQRKPLSTIRESVRIIREITSGRALEMQGTIFKVSGTKLNFKIANPIPIFIGAQGPKMLTLAAEIGDGVLINASHPKDVENAMKFIRQGAEKVGKKFEDLNIVAYTSFSIASNYDKAFKAVVPVVAYIVAGSPEIILKRHGIPVELASKIRNAIVHGLWKEAFSSVDDNMAEAFSICGAPEICIGKIGKLVELGVNQIVVGSPIGPNMRKSINMIASEVFPHFKEAVGEKRT
ncbi:5,10-methylenetetrahydromethanopterin reductase [Candidatus Bathyarchaeota archaeon]|nr:MAG: 5,10-methylenetetrahydromethanopterin reductase [Candidatus Bathyarchaeota archaeon]